MSREERRKEKNNTDRQTDKRTHIERDSFFFSLKKLLINSFYNVC